MTITARSPDPEGARMRSAALKEHSEIAALDGRPRMVAPKGRGSIVPKGRGVVPKGRGSIVPKGRPRITVPEERS